MHAQLRIIFACVLSESLQCRILITAARLRVMDKLFNLHQFREMFMKDIDLEF